MKNTTSGTALSRLRDTLPRMLLATNNFAAGSFMRPTSVAQRMRDIAPDPGQWITAIRIDVDRDDASTSWLDAELPRPSIITVNPANGHAHLSWLLGCWIPKSNPKALAYFKAVRRAMTRAIGGDPNYSGRFTHNPLHPAFWTVSGPAAYELSELAAYCDLSQAEKSTRIRDLDPLGRNSALFQAASAFGRRCVREFRARADQAGFSDSVSRLLAEANADLTPPLGASEVAGIARSVTRWCWYKYAKVTPLRKRRYVSTRKQYLGAAAERRTKARTLAASGTKTAEIAKLLGVSARAVRGYLSTEDIAIRRIA